MTTLSPSSNPPIVRRGLVGKPADDVVLALPVGSRLRSGTRCRRPLWLQLSVHSTAIDGGRWRGGFLCYSAGEYS
jgi:hypothetical protein